MNKLKELYDTTFNYDMTYDYDDMKLVLVCDNFIEDRLTCFYDFEDIIRISTWVRCKYNEEFETLSDNEKGYIQEYAQRILSANIDEIWKIMRGN